MMLEIRTVFIFECVVTTVNGKQNVDMSPKKYRHHAMT